MQAAIGSSQIDTITMWHGMLHLISPTDWKVEDVNLQSCTAIPGLLTLPEQIYIENNRIIWYGLASEWKYGRNRLEDFRAYCRQSWKGTGPIQRYFFQKCRLFQLVKFRSLRDWSLNRWIDLHLDSARSWSQQIRTMEWQYIWCKLSNLEIRKNYRHIHLPHKMKFCLTVSELFQLLTII